MTGSSFIVEEKSERNKNLVMFALLMQRFVFMLRLVSMMHMWLPYCDWETGVLRSEKCSSLKQNVVVFIKFSSLPASKVVILTVFLVQPLMKIWSKCQHWPWVQPVMKMFSKWQHFHFHMVLLFQCCVQYYHIEPCAVENLSHLWCCYIW